MLSQMLQALCLKNLFLLLLDSLPLVVNPATPGIVDHLVQQPLCLSLLLSQQIVFMQILLLSVPVQYYGLANLFGLVSSLFGL